MSSRGLLAIFWSLLYLCIVASAAYIFFFRASPLKARLVLGIIGELAVGLWVTWFLITRYRRYDSRPFQIKHTFRMRISNREEDLGPIVIDGPALLILDSNVARTAFSLNILNPANAKIQKYVNPGHSDTDFAIHQTGRWSATLAARQLGRIRKAQQGGWATITLEVRGNCQVHELPSSAQEGFPVVTRPSDQRDNHHL